MYATQYDSEPIGIVLVIGLKRLLDNTGMRASSAHCRWYTVTGTLLADADIVEQKHLRISFEMVLKFGKGHL